MATNVNMIRNLGEPAESVRIARWAATPHPKLGELGAEREFDAEESAIVDERYRSDEP